VYRARGIAGADCGRVGSGAGSYFVWSLFDRPEEVEESQESAKSSIENTKTGGESGEREEVPDLDTEANAKCEMQNEKCELEERASAEPTRLAGTPAATEASGRGNGNSHESAKTSIENTKTGEESGEREELPDLDTEANAKCEMQNEKCELEEEASAEPTRLAGTPEATEASGDEIGNAQERANSSIENTKRGVARGARGPRSHPPRRRHAEAESEAARSQNEFSDPTTDTERQEQCDAPSAQPVEQPCTQKGEGSTPEHRGICIRYGESEPIPIASMSSNLLWKRLTKEHYIPELKQEIERVLRERCDPRMWVRDEKAVGRKRGKREEVMGVGPLPELETSVKTPSGKPMASFEERRMPFSRNQRETPGGKPLASLKERGAVFR